MAKRLVVGILAHVDAGKTTLSESILYNVGRIRSLGRVDNGDAYLDTNHLEKERGITIFSKMATFPLRDVQVTLLDTPGHVDFSAEMEKTLSVLDYAILVINGADGVQGHTETLWKLLAQYQIPVFLFVNKMDQSGTDAAELMRNLEKHFGDGIVDFSPVHFSDADAAIYTMPEDVQEAVAMTDEHLMEQYLSVGELRPQDIRNRIWDRKVFPVFFGSALKNTGVDTFLKGLYAFTTIPLYPSAFGARVFKIAKDEQGRRLTYLKVTGGSIKVREELLPEQKVSEIRFYSGVRYETAEEAEAGAVCAILGMRDLKTGDTLGAEPKGKDPSLKPVLDYEVHSEDTDTLELYKKLETLSDEFPELHLRWEKELQEIHVRLMGEVQTEILERVVQERFGYKLLFGSGQILYQETIDDTVEGIGHFEPLRHYAEVHLLLEPLPRGSGLQFRSDCSTDQLAINWQRLVLTHLQEREHAGVLTGSPVTDIRFTLIAGRAHQKHTEGGDFRQATYRAVRQGLRKATNVLLEPFYEFTLELPQEYVGRAMTDITNMNGHVEPPEILAEKAILKGSAPVVTMRDYHKEVMIYTKGRGRLEVRFSGYDRCHNAGDVIIARNYDPDADLRNPTGSVFCAHGTGFIVPFNEVENYMHVPSPLTGGGQQDFEADAIRLERAAKSARQEAGGYKKSGNYIADQELEDIFVRTFGPIKNRAKLANDAATRTIRANEKAANLEKSRDERRERNIAGASREKSGHPMKDYLLVDGYNIIFAWDDLNALAKENLDAARSKLLDVMSDYAGFTGREVIVVFDAYRVQGHVVEQLRYHNIYEVFTREAMTADQYIEELTHELRKQYQVTVATGDSVVQVITWGAGATILSARNLQEEVDRMKHAVRTEHLTPMSVVHDRLTARLELPE